MKRLVVRSICVVVAVFAVFVIVGMLVNYPWEVAIAGSKAMMVGSP